MLPALQRLLDDNPAGDIHVVASGDPLLHGIGTQADPPARRRERAGAAARVVSDTGLRPDGLECAGHRGHQPGHRARTHRRAPRRTGGGVVPQRPPHPPSWPAYWSKLVAGLRNSPSSNSSEAPMSGPAVARPTPGPPRRRVTSTTSTWSPSATCPTIGSPRPCRMTIFTTTARSPNRPSARSPSPRSHRGPVNCCGTSVPALAASPSSGAAAHPAAGRSRSRSTRSVASGSPPTPGPSASRWTSATTHRRTSTAQTHPRPSSSAAA